MLRPDYDEFDDVDRRHAPYIASPKALAAMRALAAEHALGFVFNPGGGQFTCMDSSAPLYGLVCQIGTNDDVADLAALRNSITKKLQTSIIPPSGLTP
jgi:predicted alpha/beta hydrolase